MMMISLRMRRTLAVAVIIPLLTLPASSTSTTTSDSTTEASLMQPLDISRAETVALPEDTSEVTDLGAVTCFDRSASSAVDIRCPTCSILSVNPSFAGFTLLKMLGNLDFHLYYVPSIAALSYATTPWYKVTVTCSGQNQITGTRTIKVAIHVAETVMMPTTLQPELP